MQTSPSKMQNPIVPSNTLVLSSLQESLSLAEQRRSLQQQEGLAVDLDHLPPKLQEMLIVGRCSSMETTTPSSQSTCLPGNSQPMDAVKPSLHHSLPPHSTYFTAHRDSKALGYSPCTSPAHAPIRPDSQMQGKDDMHSKSVGSFLAQIEHSINLRQMAAAAEKVEE